jgi:Cu+-exporting ATPase
MDNTSPAPRHFQLVHALKNRIRLIVPGLAQDYERSYLLAILLRKHQGILTVRTVPEIGSVAVYFNPKRLPKPKLLTLLDTLISNLGQPSAQPKQALRVVADTRLPLRDFNLAIEGMSCASCALLIEVRLKRDPRIKAASVNFATATAAVRGHLAKADLFAQISSLGYRAYAADTLTQRKLLSAHEKERLAQAKGRAVWGNVLNLPSIILAVAGVSHSRWLHWFEFGTTVPIALWASWPLFAKAWRLFSKHRSASMDTLVALGVGLAYSQGFFALLVRRRAQYFEAATAVIGFVLLERYLEERARGKAHAAMRRLLDGQPQSASLLQDGRELAADIDSLKVGDVLLVRPGERIPVDGVVLDGLSKVDESLVTGESAALVKDAGAKVTGGCVNGGGVLRIRASAVGGDTVLAGIIHSLDLAQGGKLPLQTRVDQISQVFMPGVLGVAGLTFFGWLAAGASPEIALTRAITVLLTACPCALGLATPAAIMVGTGEASRRGIFIRNGASLEMASQLTVVVFDKTGTITEGKPSVTDFVNLSEESDERLLSLAASAEFSSEHYLGKALVAHTKSQGLPLFDAEDFSYVPGQGIRARVEGHAVLLGNQSWLEEQSVALAALAERADGFAAQGKTPVFVAVDGLAAGLFGLADQPRPSAAQAIRRLHQRGVKTLMLTGDTQATAEHIARQVGITEVIAQAGPQKKLDVIHELQWQGGKVGMIGDGINDAPALAAADVGFAISGGADLALDSADMSLARGDIAKVAEAMALSGATVRIVRQNLTWALGYNSVAIPLAVFGKLNPLTASIAMSVSGLSMLLNALRLQK